MTRVCGRSRSKQAKVVQLNNSPKVHCMRECTRGTPGISLSPARLRCLIGHSLLAYDHYCQTMTLQRSFTAIIYCNQPPLSIPHLSGSFNLPILFMDMHITQTGTIAHPGSFICKNYVTHRERQSERDGDDIPMGRKKGGYILFFCGWSYLLSSAYYLSATSF